MITIKIPDYLLDTLRNVIEHYHCMLLDKKDSKNRQIGLKDIIELSNIVLKQEEEKEYIINVNKNGLEEKIKFDITDNEVMFYSGEDLYIITKEDLYFLKELE